MSLRSLQLLVVGISFGILAGIGGYTFVYAKGYSYLTDDPAACANCHVMRGQHEAWQRSSHRAVAVCNDCHTPAGLTGKYSTKATNGFWHSFYFTTGLFAEPIRITERNRGVTEAACRKCHQPIVEAMQVARVDSSSISCVRCHDSVGHLR